jgi:hypothetical protein
VSGRGRSARDDRGQTAVLIIGFTLVVALMVVVVVDATAAYLRRQALNTLADGAALAAGEQVYLAGLDEHVAVDPEAARVLVASYLASVDAYRRYPGLRHSVETDADRVVVRMAAPLDLPLPYPGMGDTAHIRSTAAAVTRLGE